MISTMGQLPMLFSYPGRQIVTHFQPRNQAHQGKPSEARLQGRWQLALDLIRSMACRGDSCLHKSVTIPPSAARASWRILDTKVRASIITVTCAFGPWETSSSLLSMARQAVEKVESPALCRML